MQITFENKGIRYNLQVTPKGRREEPTLADIKPDRELWTSAQRKKAGMDKRPGKAWRNRHGGGLVLNFLEEPKNTGPRKKAAGPRPIIEIKPAPPEHFLESAPLD